MVAVNSTVRVTQGNSITLEVYISGHPTVRSTNIRWYHLNPTRQEITSGATFQDSHRRMILRNVQPSAAGTYECEATIPLFGSQILRGSARIQLQVYGKLMGGCGYPIMCCTALGMKVVSPSNTQNTEIEVFSSIPKKNAVLGSSFISLTKEKCG